MATQARNTLNPTVAFVRPVTVQPTLAHPPRAGLLEKAVVVSGAMAEVLGQIHLFAPAETVVFEGATGTGKSYLAEALHEASGRRGALVDVSAGEFEPGLALDQFFGHVRGAFTGAMSRHRGLFAEAEGGTLLIDEFQLLPRSQQAMLIRALERRVYRPIGYERDVPVTCSVVVGVEESLDRLVAAEPKVRNTLGRWEMHFVEYKRYAPGGGAWGFEGGRGASFQGELVPYYKGSFYPLLPPSILVISMPADGWVFRNGMAIFNANPTGCDCAWTPYP